MSLDVIIRKKNIICWLHIDNSGYRIKQDFAFIFHGITVEKGCISSSISFDSHLVHIRWLIGVIGLLSRPLSIFKSCELILYLAIAVMGWFPFMFKMYGSTHKDFFTNEYVRSLLELSISCLHRCVNILTIESLKESMNLFVLPMCCVSQAWSSPVSSRTDRIREHQFVNLVPSSSSSIL